MKQIQTEEIEIPKLFIFTHVVLRILFLLLGALLVVILAAGWSGIKEVDISLPLVLFLLCVVLCIANTVLGFKKGWLTRRKEESLITK